MEHFSVECKKCPNQHNNSHKLCNEKRHSSEAKSMKTETTTWPEFPIGWKVAVAQIVETKKERNPEERKK